MQLCSETRRTRLLNFYELLERHGFATFPGIRCLIFAACLVLFGAAKSESFLGAGQDVFVKDFRTRGQSRDQGGTWVLEGKDARTSGKLTRLKHFQVVFDQESGKKWLLRSSSCNFMHTLREAKSDAAIVLESDGIRASGIGYDIFLDQHVVRIRTTVKMVVRRGDFTLKDAKTKK